MRPFDWLGPITNERFRELLKDGKAVLAQVSFHGIRLRDVSEGFPYLPIAKARAYYGADKKFLADNGRFLSADYMEITITDIDFKIIESQYVWERMDVFNCYESTYDFLPEPIRRKTIEYFQRKTELKGVEGQEYYYARSKELLNSIYGMMVQDPVKQTIDFTFDDYRGCKDFVEREDNPEELLRIANRKAFLAYFWGVWVTAWARYRLHLALEIAGQQAVYCDTDSVKYVGEVDLTQLNNELRELAKESGAYAHGRNGNLVYMGVFERDAYYDKFVTLGAKKYAYEDSKGVHVTTAGVNKAKGSKELARAGGVEAYQEGFIFHDAGGTESVYNDFPMDGVYIVRTGEGLKILKIRENVYIKDSTYTLGITADYARVVANPSMILDEVRRMNEDCVINPMIL